VLERLYDQRLLQETADRAYEEIYVDGAYRYTDFAAALREALGTADSPVRPFRRGAFPAVAAANRVLAAPVFVWTRAEWRLRRFRSALLRLARLRA
jgi:hypothetical protein